MDLESIRAREFPGLGRRIHLDAASWGPHPARTGRALDAVNRRREEGGTLPAHYFTRILADARGQAARLLDASPREVALAPNTTWGIQLAATLVGAGPPGRILYCHGEFPACVLPWRSLLERGFILEEVPSGSRGRPDAARLIERIREASDLRAVTLSVVQFATGVPVELAPVVEACRARGAFLALDAIQALGVHPLPAAALEADLIASGAQKWLLSPWGSGFARIHPRHLDGPTPLPPVVSWLGFESAMDFATLLDYDPTPLPDARRFEPATLGIQDFAGMAASLGLLNEVGIDRVAAHVARVQTPLVEWLRRRGGEDSRGPVVPVTSLADGERAGIVAFRSAARDEVARRAEEEGITLSVREGLVRISPHLYSTVEEVERVVEILDEVHGPRSPRLSPDPGR